MRRNRSRAAVFAAFVMLAAACSSSVDSRAELAAVSTAEPTPTASVAPTTATPTASPSSTTEPTAQATPGRRTYTVAPGDSLAAIAQAHDVALGDLIGANGIGDPNQIAAGQELVIPAPGETYEAPAPAPTETPPPASPPATSPSSPPPEAPAPPPAPLPPPPPAGSGSQIYFNHCSGCHGGSGEGAAGPALGGGAVVARYPNVADQIAVVTGGRAAMPAYGGIISPAEIEAVVNFTRSL
jgi:mono/diheme cytochrome c family protein